MFLWSIKQSYESLLLELVEQYYRCLPAQNLHLQHTHPIGDFNTDSSCVHGPVHLMIKETEIDEYFLVSFTYSCRFSLEENGSANIKWDSITCTRIYVYVCSLLCCLGQFWRANGICFLSFADETTWGTERLDHCPRSHSSWRQSWPLDLSLSDFKVNAFPSPALLQQIYWSLVWRSTPYQEHEKVGQSLLRAMQSSGKLDKLLTWVLICIHITSMFKFEVLELSTIAGMSIFKKKSKHTWKPKRSCFRVLFPMHHPPAMTIAV